MSQQDTGRIKKIWKPYLSVAGVQDSCDSQRSEEKVERGGGTAVLLPQLHQLHQQSSDRKL